MDNLSSTDTDLPETISEITDEVTIPKHRFDEVNNKYKAARNAVLMLREENGKKDGEIRRLTAEINDLKSEHEKALNDLRVKEIFVEGGITKKDYESIIPKMTCREEERSDLARAIVVLINNKH